MSKERVIEEVYNNEETGFQSIRNTYLHAKKIDSSIKYEDVRKYLNKFKQNIYSFNI